MTDKIHTTLNFTPEQGGKGKTDKGYIVNILSGDDSARPYELLFMAMASCLNSTFEDVYKKKRLNCETVSVDVSGEKREESPKFLKTCDVKFTVKGADKQQGFEKSFELACKYCSIYQTLAGIAEMNPSIEFED